MGKPLKDALQEVLDELGKDDFERFKAKLNNLTELPQGCNPIPKGKLEEANRLALCDLIVNYYTKEGAVKVAKDVLTEINQNEKFGVTCVCLDQLLQWET